MLTDDLVMLVERLLVDVDQVTLKLVLLLIYLAQVILHELVYVQILFSSTLCCSTWRRMSSILWSISSTSWSLSTYLIIFLLNLIQLLFLLLHSLNFLLLTQYNFTPSTTYDWLWWWGWWFLGYLTISLGHFTNCWLTIIKPWGSIRSRLHILLLLCCLKLIYILLC